MRLAPTARPRRRGADGRAPTLQAAAADATCATARALFNRALLSAYGSRHLNAVALLQLVLSTCLLGSLRAFRRVEFHKHRASPTSHAKGEGEGEGEGEGASSDDESGVGSERAAKYGTCAPLWLSWRTYRQVAPPCTPPSRARRRAPAETYLPLVAALALARNQCAAAAPCHLGCESWIVVGNGGVGKEQYEAIDRSSACVAYFGRLRSFQSGGRISLLVSRHGSRRPRWSEVPSRTPVCPVVASLDTIPRGRDAWPGGYLDPIHVYEKDYADRGELEPSASLFQRCPVCADGSCMHSRAPNGPSTGAAFLSYLEDQATVRQIDVYGMTFQNHNAKFHVDWLVDRLVARCCPKCRIHAASSAPPPSLFRTLSSFARVGVRPGQPASALRRRGPPTRRIDH